MGILYALANWFSTVGPFFQFRQWCILIEMNVSTGKRAAIELGMQRICTGVVKSWGVHYTVSGACKGGTFLLTAAASACKNSLVLSGSWPETILDGLAAMGLPNTRAASDKQKQSEPASDWRIYFTDLPRKLVIPVCGFWPIYLKVTYHAQMDS